MSRLTPLYLTLACTFGVLVAASAPARVLTLSYQTDTTAVVRDAAAGDSTVTALTSPQGRLLVGTGLIAADAAHDLVYVVANTDPLGPGAGAPAAVLFFRYGSSPLPSGSLVAPSGRYFTALAFDPTAARIVGVVTDASDPATVVPQVFTVSTSNGTSIGLPTYVNANAGCCRFSAGIAAWRASSQELFMVGRRNGDTQDQLLRFNLGGGAPGPDAYPITGDSLIALAIDSQNGNLYGLAHGVVAFTRLVQITYSAPGSAATLSSIGSAPSECCYVAGGPATIDGSGAARALFVLDRDAATIGPMRLSSFNLASGTRQVVRAASNGYGLWTDPAATFDRIFANGFE
ncbi:MAG: hypothetical protein ABIW82_06555 [Dokdonella sp.]